MKLEKNNKASRKKVERTSSSRSGSSFFGLAAGAAAGFAAGPAAEAAPATETPSALPGKLRRRRGSAAYSARGRGGDPGVPGAQQRGDVVVPPRSVRVGGGSRRGGEGHVHGQVVAGRLEPVGGGSRSRVAFLPIGRRRAPATQRAALETLRSAFALEKSEGSRWQARRGVCARLGV